MSDKGFFDTNILAYLFDSQVPRKAVISEGLLRKARVLGNGVVSYQVLQEFANVALRKFDPVLPAGEVLTFLEKTARDYEVVPFSLALCKEALSLWDRHQLSWYDALIVAAAAQAGCDVLYTEDGPTGQIIAGVRLVNPFLVPDSRI